MVEVHVGSNDSVRLKNATNLLMKLGEEFVAQPYQKIEFTKKNNPAADDLLNDLQKFPHAFVLGCVMDRQIDAIRAWIIPYRISQEIGGFEFSKLLSLDLGTIKDIFARLSLHRFSAPMAEYFYLAIQRIHTEYAGNASNIWANNPRSATVVRRFLQFRGIGIKIATMAANILSRDFKIPVQDKTSIEISPDVRVRRIFTRLGLISEYAKNDEIIYLARELNPSYPGVFDLPTWNLGDKLCIEIKPECEECYLGDYCLKHI